MESESKQPKTWKRRTAIIAVVAAFFIGGMIGASGSSSDAAPKVETKTVTKTVTKQVTPKSCRELISVDNDILSTVGNALGEYGNDMTDVTPINKATAHVKSVTPHRLDLVDQCEGK